MFDYRRVRTQWFWIEFEGSRPGMLYTYRTSAYKNGQARAVCCSNPKVIKSLLENLPSIDVFFSPSYKPPFSFGIFQPRLMTPDTA
jgi:hypothetical protein